MPQRACSANFINQYGPRNKNTPDTFFHDEYSSRPSDDFVISRTLEGEPLSRYGDKVWDLRPYRLAGNTGYARLRFSYSEDTLNEEAKWLMFLFLFVAEPPRHTVLAISSVVCLWKGIRKLILYSKKRAIYVREIFADENEMVRFVASLKTRDSVRNFSRILAILLKIPSEESGYHVLGATKFELITNKLKSLGNDEQHPVIPPRIYFNLMQQLDRFISEIDTHKHQLFRFLERTLESKGFGRAKCTQEEHGYTSKNYEPTLNEASELYHLNGLFEKYGVRNISAFSKFLTNIQHGCRLQIHIYTGMRQGEALSLKVGALHSIKSETGESYKFIGETSKLVGQKKIVSWVTSKEVIKAYEILNGLAKIAGKFIKIKKTEVPLFISMSYLCLGNNHYYDRIQVKTATATSKSQEVYELLDCTHFTISEPDLEHLEQVNPFRAWESENAFALGSVWRFTIHQLRRSLAFYVAQSSHVSLPSLKRQLKHINKEMTLYYCHTKTPQDEYCVEGHISGLIKREKPEADAIAYIYDVLKSKEPLFGAHGKFVERNVKKSAQDVLLKQDRNELIKQFKNGEIAYKETPLGACTTIAPCDKKLFRNITSCISCDRAVIKPSKLERLVDKQAQFVEELAQTNCNTVEYRTELAELEALKSYQNKVISEGK